MTETVFALASGAGRAGVAVVRLSGPAAGSALTALTGCRLPPPRRATVARLRDPQSGDLLDRGLVLWFPQPASFTGEDVAELHLHGGRAVIAAVADSLGGLTGVRAAEPGEFSRRAFDNGKLDLTEAEAIADLVAAETAAQRRQALRQMEGTLGRLYDGWRTRLVLALGHVEADLDFPDEDLPAGLMDRIGSELTDLSAEIRGHLDDGRCGERLREGARVAILGPPNAGKSSLLNALVRRDAAIVADNAGTTRDIIEVHLDLAGYPVVLADTAGIRAVSEAVEEEGVRRALSRGADADLKLLVFDGGTWPDLAPDVLALADGRSMVVLNKADLGSGSWPMSVGGRETVILSARTGQGVDRLISVATDRVSALFDGSAPMPLTRARHRRALEDCAAALARTVTAPAPELVAEDLRLAVRAVGRITGAVDVDDVLDIIFREFCIGK